MGDLNKLTRQEGSLLMELLWKSQMASKDETERLALFEIMNKLDEMFIELGYAGEDGSDIDEDEDEE
jgi:hypothetical protein